MVPKPNPCFLDGQEKHNVIGGDQVWANGKRSRFYTWDSLHGEIEVFNKRGKHLGVLDPVTGEMIKDDVPGRRIDV